jgi:hypothetical protein
MSNYDGMKAAAASLAKTMKRVAVVRTRRTADAVNVTTQGSVWLIRGGKPGGEWGWDPITAAMFTYDLRHPFFGDKRKWYNQSRTGPYDIPGITADQGADEAADEYAKNAIDPLLEEHGFEE